MRLEILKTQKIDAYVDKEHQKELDAKKKKCKWVINYDDIQKQRLNEEFLKRNYKIEAKKIE